MFLVLLLFCHALLGRRLARGVAWQGGPGSGAGDRASRTRDRTRATATDRWSAGRRSVSVAGLRTPLDHRTRAPRDGIRNPVRMGFATPSRQGAWALPNEGGAREASQPSHGGLANPRRLPALHSLVEG